MLRMQVTYTPFHPNGIMLRMVNWTAFDQSERSFPYFRTESVLVGMATRFGGEASPGGRCGGHRLRLVKILRTML